MEEEKSIKFKKGLKKVSNIISYVFITILMLIAAFLVLYIICGKIAEKKGENPPFALYTIISPSMTPKIQVYDVVFVKKTDPEKIKVGDVITFYSTNTYFGNTPITHRVVEILTLDDNSIGFKVKGDANSLPDDESVLSENIIGKVIFKIPGLGKIQYFLASKKGWIFAILVPSLIILGYDIYKIIRLFSLKNKLKKFNTENKETIEQIESQKREEIIHSNIQSDVINIENKE